MVILFCVAVFSPFFRKVLLVFSRLLRFGVRGRQTEKPRSLSFRTTSYGSPTFLLEVLLGKELLYNQQMEL